MKIKLLIAAVAIAMLMIGGAPADDSGDQADDTQSVRLYVEGAYCAGCSAVLKSALLEGGVKNPSKIAPNAGRGYVIVLGGLANEADLSAVAKVVNDADTPHREQAAPGISLELFAELDKKSAATAESVLAKLEGVDAEGSLVDAPRGVIAVRLTGKGKLTASQVITSLNKAGIKAKIVTGNKKAAEKAKADETE